MSDFAAARRYARALADALAKHEAQDRALVEVREFEKWFAADTFLRAHLLDARVKALTREKTLDAVAKKAGFMKETANFLRLVARHGRFAIFSDIVRLYAAELDRRRGIVRARVRSGAPLTREQEKALAAAIAKSTGKTAALDVSEDATLLAGVVVQIGSRVYDASLKTQIAALARKLAAA